jgi:type I restriction enzyme, S subunit
MKWKWTKFKLDKLETYVEIQPGYAFKSSRFLDDETQVPLVKGDNLQQGYIQWEEAKYWSYEDYDALRKFHLYPGDIIVAMDRPWVTAGLKWSYIKPHEPRSLLVQRVARLRARSDLSQDYLRHLISSSYFSAYIQPIVTGVNVPHISGKQIGDFLIPLPKKEIQRKIATILSAYDDRIENNKRRIAILEKMAEEIYREWFVRFRFPGYQNAEFEKGIPKDWKLQKLKDIVELAYGKALKAEERVFGKFPVYGSSGVVGFHNEAIVNGSGIIVGRKGNVGSVHWAHTGFYPIDTVYYVESKLPNCYLYHLLRSLNFINNDSAVPGLNRNQAYSNGVLFPGSYLLDQYDKVTKPIYEQVISLDSSNENLLETKRLLLPRLISGKILVEDLDIQFPPSMKELAEIENTV